MNWGKVLEKGVAGLLTVVTSVLVSMIPEIQAWIAGKLPEEIAQLTIVGAVGFFLNALANWLKHRK